MNRNKSGFLKFLKKEELVLGRVTPKSKNQAVFFQTYEKGLEDYSKRGFFQNHALIGYPGTGKTFLALYKAFELMMVNNTIKKIVIIRSPATSSNIGFVPGDLNDKSLPFIPPYVQACATLFGRDDAFQRIMEAGFIDFQFTSFTRGGTLNDSVVIVDEIQNLTFNEADTSITRVGDNSQYIICGDIAQSDLKGESKEGVKVFLNILSKMPLISFQEFEVGDIVRSGLNKSYIEVKVDILGL